MKVSGLFKILVILSFKAVKGPNCKLSITCCHFIGPFTVTVYDPTHLPTRSAGTLCVTSFRAVNVSLLCFLSALYNREVRGQRSGVTEQH